MSFVQRWQQSFSRSPGTWILAGALAYSIYSNWQTGSEFSKVCGTVIELSQGYFDLETADQMLATGVDEDAIMERVDRVMELRQADSVEGRAYRWWEAKSSYVVNACSNRLAEPPPEPDE